MARALIVGCGCRGQALAAALAAAGHAVRGTSRDPERLPAIETAGAEGLVADPNRLSTLVAQLEGVSVLCWLMGTAAGDADTVAAIHGPRLESMLASIVDTPVRGFVYEGAGTVEPSLLERGAAIVGRAGETHRMAVEVVGVDPGDGDGWLREAVAAVQRVLGA